MRLHNMQLGIVCVAVVLFTQVFGIDVEIVETDMDGKYRTFTRDTLFSLYNQNLPIPEIILQTQNRLDEAYGRYWSVFIGTQSLMGGFHAKKNSTMKAKVGDDQIIVYRHEFLNEADFIDEGNRNRAEMEYTTNMGKDVVDKFVYQFGLLLETRNDFVDLADSAVKLIEEKIPRGHWVADIASRGVTSFIESEVSYLQISYDILRITLLDVGDCATTVPPPETTTDAATTVEPIKCAEHFVNCSQEFYDSKTDSVKIFAIPKESEMSKQQAREMCTERSATLVEIGSDMENEFVKKYLYSIHKRTDLYYYWLGLTYNVDDNTWKRDSDGQTATYLKWGPRLPGPDDREAEMTGSAGAWYPITLGFKFVPVCQIIL